MLQLLRLLVVLLFVVVGGLRLLLLLLLLGVVGGLVLGHIQMGVNCLRYGLNLCAELLLNLVEGESVLVGDEIDGNTQVTESSGTTNTMQVGLGHLGKVKVDDNVDRLDVNTASEQI